MLRRDLVKGILGCTLLLCGKTACSRPSGHCVVNAILGIFSNPASAANIGQIYLEKTPYERDITYLTDKIFAGWDKNKRHFALSEQATLKEMLTTQCKRDFQTAEVYSIDGWVLSRTELRLFAVAYLAG